MLFTTWIYDIFSKPIRGFILTEEVDSHLVSNYKMFVIIRDILRYFIYHKLTYHMIGIDKFNF